MTTDSPTEALAKARSRPTVYQELAQCLLHVPGLIDLSGKSSAMEVAMCVAELLRGRGYTITKVEPQAESLAATIKHVENVGQAMMANRVLALEERLDLWREQILNCVKESIAYSNKPITERLDAIEKRLSALELPAQPKPAVCGYTNDELEAVAVARGRFYETVTGTIVGKTNLDGVYLVVDGATLGCPIGTRLKEPMITREVRKVTKETWEPV